MNKTLVVAIAALIVSVVSLFVAFDASKISLGGITNYDELDDTDGYRVDNTTVIDGSGNVDAPITSSTGTFSGATVFSATSTFAADTFIDQLQSGTGTVTLSAPATLTANEVCTNGYITTIGATVTFPTAASLIADCLTVPGRTHSLYLANVSTSGSVTFTAGAGNRLLSNFDNGSTSNLLFNRATRIFFTATSSIGVDIQHIMVQ